METRLGALETVSLATVLHITGGERTRVRRAAIGRKGSKPEEARLEEEMGGLEMDIKVEEKWMRERG